MMTRKRNRETQEGYRPYFKNEYEYRLFLIKLHLILLELKDESERSRHED